MLTKPTSPYFGCPRMDAGPTSRIPALVDKHATKLLAAWLERQTDAGSLRSGQIKEEELKEQSQQFLRAFNDALKAGHTDDITGSAWEPARDLLGEFSRARAAQGFTPSETATFVFSFKEPLFSLLRDEVKGNAQLLGDEIWTATRLIDKLGLFTTEIYQQSRDE